jgi:hypothetical protein
MKNLQNDERGFMEYEFIVGIVAIIIFFLAIFRGTMVDEKVAYQAAEIQGYSNVEVVDHAWFFVGLRGCSSHDAARFTVKATNPAGKDVEYYVCSGWIFKGATIRTK